MRANPFWLFGDISLWTTLYIMLVLKIYASSQSKHADTVLVIYDRAYIQYLPIHPIIHSYSLVHSRLTNQTREKESTYYQVFLYLKLSLRELNYRNNVYP